MLEILSYPFMQRAFLAGGICAILLGCLGVYVVSRKMSFIGDGLAHASLAGVALALLVGWAPVPVAMVVSVILAVLIFVMERKVGLSSDMAIGIVFTSGMAMGVVLMHFYTGFQPELIGFLFGNILAVSTSDVIFTAVVGSLILMILVACSRKLALVTLDPEGAWLSGIHPDRYILLLYICLALTIVVSIQLVGIILVSALLIMPAAISKRYATSFVRFQMYALIAALAIVIFGLIAGALLITPGFFTDFVGFLLLWPQGRRRVIKRMIASGIVIAAQQQAQAGQGSAGGFGQTGPAASNDPNVIDGEFRRDD